MAYFQWAFVPFTGNVRDIPCVQEERAVSNDNTVRYKGLVLRVAANRHRHHFVKANSAFRVTRL